MRIQRLDTYEKIANSLKSANIPLVFFNQAQMLDVFFNNEKFELYTIEHRDHTYFFTRKLRTMELRLLFEIFPQEVVEFLKKELKPPYIAYNELITDPKNEHQIKDPEITVDIARYVDLGDKKVRKHYNQAERNNTNLVFKTFKNISRNNLELFWKSWAEQLSTREKFSDRTSNDARFFERYSEDQFFGIVAYEGEKLVAYSIGIHQTNTHCLSAFNKALRGYTNLGLQVSYKKAEQALSETCFDS